MEKKMVKNSKLRPSPNREQEYELYCTWKALPPVFRGKPDQFNGTGIEDGVARELLEIKSQLDFAAKYKLDKNTVTKWNKRIEVDDRLYQERKKMVKRLMSNVLIAVYRKALEEGDASRATFLAKYAGEFIEKKELTGTEGGPIQIVLPPEIAEKYNIKSNESNPSAG